MGERLGCDNARNECTGQFGLVSLKGAGFANCNQVKVGAIALLAVPTEKAQIDSGGRNLAIFGAANQMVAVGRKEQCCETTNQICDQLHFFEGELLGQDEK